jgi:organic radical activating enzyme|tara:strand:- start:2162 stop:3115 length:954 start_codon:yes stop_codon:yes gene_type:complete
MNTYKEEIMIEAKTYNSKVKKEPKLRYSEAFYSVQGEGRWVGVPSIFLRTFGCNFECAGFGQPRGDIIAKESMPYLTDERADKDHPDAYKSIEDLPVTPIGCDSSASWAAKYKHLQMTKSVSEVINHIISLLPNGTFQGRHGEDIHLVITGGEPLLGWQRVWPDLIDRLHKEFGLFNVTFETNGSKHCEDNMTEYFNSEGKDVHVTWSTSPKLSISAETLEDTLKPDALVSMNNVTNSYLYNKFVVRDKIDFDEVDMYVDAYKKAGVKLDAIYCMPEGATFEQQELTEKDVAEACMETGYKFSPRLHISLFGNAWGT